MDCKCNLSAVYCAGWQYQGELVTGDSPPCQDGKEYDLGAMWECPFFVNLAPDGQQVWMLCVSPYPHHLSDRPTNPCLYWLGPLEGERFSLQETKGLLLAAG